MKKFLIHSGYDAKNVASLNQKHKCPICGLVLRNPVQMACGHRICQLSLPYNENIVKCPECSETTLISKIKLDIGFIKDMETLLIICIFCEWSGQLKIYENHLEQSHNQYRCSYCNEIFNSLTVLDQHIERICPLMRVNCKLQRYGCKEEILRCNLHQHYLSEEHQRTLLLFTVPPVSTMTEANQKLARFDGHVEQEMIDLPYKATTATSTCLVTNEYNVQEEDIKETIDTLVGGIKALNDEMQRLNDESSEQSQLIKTADQSIATLKTSCEESNASLNALYTNMIILQQTCSSLKQKVEEIQSISYDGTLIWKITDVQQKMTNAESERQVSIYSPPFYSSPTGYKMRVRLYFFGDGNARGTHMSLFFVLMRSSNDPLLQFPFHYKVVFCLIDQSGQQRHIIDSFSPDTKSNSFQKPRCDMNIASGIPKFVSISTIQQPDNPYVKSDTMFLKVMVDFGQIPKTMLPYALNLNPGLPTHCQQQLIQQEMERRKQL